MLTPRRLGGFLGLPPQHQSRCSNGGWFPAVILPTFRLPVERNTFPVSGWLLATFSLLCARSIPHSTPANCPSSKPCERRRPPSFRPLGDTSVGMPPSFPASVSLHPREFRVRMSGPQCRSREPNQPGAAAAGARLPQGASCQDPLPALQLSDIISCHDSYMSPSRIRPAATKRRRSVAKNVVPGWFISTSVV